MNVLPKIRVMVSSRSNSEVFDEQVQLTDIRRRLQSMLHSVRWSNQTAEDAPAISSGQQIFDVWIHESEPAKSTKRGPFDLSLDEIRKADIVIVLYNGEAGDKLDDRGIGICHAEFQEAVSRRGNIVYLIRLAPLPSRPGPSDKKFREAIERARPFEKAVKSEQEMQQAILELLHKAVADLVKRGASGGRSRDRGLALDWSRLDMSRRRDKMRNALATELFVPGKEARGEGPCKIELARSKFAVCLHAVPGAMGVAAAREMLGQPFLRDHLWADELTRQTPGVIHLIACYKGVTENQATKIIGTPDTMTVASDFGVYAADHVQQIQMVFLANCADTVAVAVAVGRLHEWLKQTGEIEHIERRATGRMQIVKAIRLVIG